MTGTQIGGGGNTKPQQHSGTILETSLSTKFTKHTIFNKSFFITNAFGKIEKFSGFTLAEVLITLGIIGIVAAMTIPNIVGNYKKKVVETRLQRFYSVANNALLASQAENESWDFWYFETNDTIENTKKWYDIYLAKYWKTVKVEVLNDGFVAAYFPDGSLCVVKSGIDYFYYPDAKNFDKNTFSTQRFSKYGKDIFVFGFRPQRKDNKQSYRKGIQPYLAQKSATDEDGNLTWNGGYDYTLEELYNDPAYGCKEGSSGGAAYCTQVIFQNGWKIPEDYPFKF